MNLSERTERHARSLSKKGIALSLTLISTFILTMFACSSSAPNASGTGNTGNPAGSLSCTTPQMGCPCTPGSVVACGKKLNADLNFIYCFEGHRYCDADTSLYGDCLQGNVVPKAITSIHTLGQGTGSPCSSASTSASEPLKVCTSGKHRNDICLSDADCGNGVKQCFLGGDNGNNCDDDSDCADPGSCVSWDGTCSGGARNGKGCNALTALVDCVGGTCSISGGGGTCVAFAGICDNGASDGQQCNTGADCPGGTCEAGHGRCNGGKKNDKKCRHNRHCKGGACSAEDPDAGGDSGVDAIDPCDPYCNVQSDTPFGFDAGPDFSVVDGGTVSGLAANVCGDGVLNGFDECDDGNITGGDGCSSDCLIEFGFQCPTPGAPCVPSTCGNGTQEGAEECDDGNLRPYDGCSPTCQREIVCPVVGACTAVCGDGIKFSTEDCDDGNLRDGDGCSAACTIETGITCTLTIPTPPPTLSVDVIYRDFDPATSPDFEGPCCGNSTGIVQNLLGVDKEPVYNGPGSIPLVTSATTFNQWYHDTPGVNQNILGQLTLTQQPDGSYVYDSAVTPLGNLPPAGGSTYAGFFPLDNKGLGNYGGTGHNFHFTSELRYQFTYAGGEVLSFTGDDDVFVFVNGKLAVDIGGVHGASGGSVTLDAPAAATFALTVGQTYEVVVFQAERHTVGSNYKLTLRGFSRVRSLCTPPVNLTVTRDYEAQCPAGTQLIWQSFEWKASCPPGNYIDFRAATADTQLLLPPTPPPAAPTTVPIGRADQTTSPEVGTGIPPAVETFVHDQDALGNPITVATHLKNEGNNTPSKEWLRVYMTFNPAGGRSPRLDEWRQLYDCKPNE